MSPEGGAAGDANKGTNSPDAKGAYGRDMPPNGLADNDGVGNLTDRGGLLQQKTNWNDLSSDTKQQYTSEFKRYIDSSSSDELSMLKDIYIQKAGNEEAGVSEMVKQFYVDLSVSPVIAENRWGNFIPELSELADSFNRLSAQHSGTQTTPEGMGAMSGSTYELLSDPRALKLLEQYNGNVPKTEAEKRAELARLYEDLFAEQQAGKTAVEKDKAQGYNGNWNRLYDQNVQGTGAFIDGLLIIDGKVGGKIPVDEFKAIRQSSIKNPDADSITLGRYTNGPDSYIARAGKDSSYFDMGSAFDTIREEYGLSKREMFDYFNRLVLDDAITSGKAIKFSHDPRLCEKGFLVDEWEFLKSELNLTDADLVFEGGFWNVRLK